MNRAELLGKLVKLPLLGALFAAGASPVAQYIEMRSATLGTAEESSLEEVPSVEHAFAGMTDAEKYISTPWRPGWPNLQDLSVAAQQGFDRVEVWARDEGVLLYQGPTVPGKVPVGWQSLEDSFIRR